MRARHTVRVRHVNFLSALLTLTADALPTEFCIFAAGENSTSKGVFLFDAAAAKAVMAAYEQQGVLVPVDLEHDALNEQARANRADAADARGWFKLELRKGELWAVDVAWTPDGARRLTEKTQRYISPAFVTEPIEGSEARRVVEIVNVALCAMPATHGAPALASRNTERLRSRSQRASVGLSARVTRVSKTRKLERLTMDPAQLKKALDLIESGDAAGALELLKSIVSSAAGGDDGAPADDALAENADTAPPKPGEEPAAMSALRKELGELKTSITALTASVSTSNAERAANELAERVQLTGDLVKLGAELPATAWEGEGDKRKPVARLLSEPIASLRGRVNLLRKNKPTLKTREHEAPESEATELTDQEKRLTAKMSAEQKAKFVELRNARKAKG
jgi:phage I-like protein